jgi:hypothetical protein
MLRKVLFLYVMVAPLSRILKEKQGYIIFLNEAKMYFKAIKHHYQIRVVHNLIYTVRCWNVYKTCYSWNKADPCHGTCMMHVQMKPVWRLFWSTAEVVKISPHVRWSPIPWLPSSKNLVGFCWTLRRERHGHRGPTVSMCASINRRWALWIDSALGTLETDCVALSLLVLLRQMLHSSWSAFRVTRKARWSPLTRSIRQQNQERVLS